MESCKFLLLSFLDRWLDLRPNDGASACYCFPTRLVDSSRYYYVYKPVKIDEKSRQVLNVTRLHESVSLMVYATQWMVHQQHGPIATRTAAQGSRMDRTPQQTRRVPLKKKKANATDKITQAICEPFFHLRVAMSVISLKQQGQL
jgi:hypothetical protein